MNLEKFWSALVKVIHASVSDFEDQEYILGLVRLAVEDTREAEADEPVPQ